MTSICSLRSPLTGAIIGVAIAEIEEKYQVNIPTDELGNTPTIKSIYRVVAHHANWPE